MGLGRGLYSEQEETLGLLESPCWRVWAERVTAGACWGPRPERGPWTKHWPWAECPVAVGQGTGTGAGGDFGSQK